MNNRIKNIRKQSGLNQADFGNRIGVSRDTVANIEGGRIEIKDLFIKSICREFNVNEQWLRTGDGDPYQHLEVNDTITRTAELLGRRDPFLESFLEVYGKMSNSARAVMIDALEEIVELYKSKKE